MIRKMLPVVVLLGLASTACVVIFAAGSEQILRKSADTSVKDARFQRAVNQVGDANVAVEAALESGTVAETGEKLSDAGRGEVVLSAGEVSGLEAAFTTVVEDVAASVVSVVAEVQEDKKTAAASDVNDKIEWKGARVRLGVADVPVGMLSWKMQPGHEAPKPVENARTVGSGFVLTSDGLVVTAEHVVAGTRNVWVVTDGGRRLPAVVVGSDPLSDLAVLRVPVVGLKAKEFKPVRFGKPEAVVRGQWVLAMGNPFGLSGRGEVAVSVGVVSAVNRHLPKLAQRENRLYSGLFQTTAAINPGNSGGPLFDLSGNVVAVNAAVVMPQKNTNGIGFALPTTRAVRDRLVSIGRSGTCSYGWIGASFTNAGASGAVVVRDVADESPAKGVLRAGDVIVSMAGQTVETAREMDRLISDAKVGSLVKVSIVRDMTPRTVQLEVKAMPADSWVNNEPVLVYQGARLIRLPGNWREYLGVNDGLLVVSADERKRHRRHEGLVGGAILQAAGGLVLNDVNTARTVLNGEAGERGAYDFANVTADQIRRVEVTGIGGLEQ